MRIHLPIQLDRRAWISIGVAFLLGGLLTLAGFTLAGATGNGNVVATVNGESITKSEFYARLEREAGDRVLEQLITELLVDQAEETYGISVTQEEIDAEIEALKAKYPSEEAFNADLERYGLTMERLARELHLNLILQKLSSKDVEITEAEIQAYFEENKETLSRPEQIRVRHILVDTEKEALEIKAELEGGADFAEVARARSTDTGTAAQGGDLGFIQKDSPIVPVFKDAAFALEIGQVSDPVESDFGWHLIRVDERLEAKEATLESSRDQIVETLTQQKSRPVGEILGELREAAKIDIHWPEYQELAQDPEAEPQEAAEDAAESSDK